MTQILQLLLGSHFGIQLTALTHVSCFQISWRKFCYVQEGLEAYTIILVFSRQPNVQCKHKVVINYWIN